MGSLEQTTVRLIKIFFGLIFGQLLWIRTPDLHATTHNRQGSITSIVPPIDSLINFRSGPDTSPAGGLVCAPL